MRKQKYQTEEERLEAIRESKRKWREANKEKIIERKKQYRQDNKKKIAERNKQWREKNTEYQKQYRQTPIGRAANMVGSYKRADKEMNRGECTLTAKWVVENIFTSKCVYCGENDWKELGCDRIDNSKPHTEDNVVCSCEACNKKEIQSHLMSFLQSVNKRPNKYCYLLGLYHLLLFILPTSLCFSSKLLKSILCLFCDGFFYQIT